MIISCNMDLFEFERMVGFWSGAKSHWDNFTDEEKEYLNSIAEDCEFTSLAQVNDFIWFEAEDILNDWVR